MSAETQPLLAGPASGGFDAPDRAAARIAAHRLVQQVQRRDTGDEVAQRLAQAEARGWSEVVRVLLYVEVVKAWVRGATGRETTITTLLDRAEADGDPVLLASALASRAEYQYASASAALRESANRDLARAAALLEAGGGGALERGTAYIDCGLAYGQRELWELEEEMYTRAAESLPACEEPLLGPAVAVNRAMVNVHTACSLREMADDEGLRQLWTRVGATPEIDTLGTALPVPNVFGVEIRVIKYLFTRLVREQPAEAPATLDLALTVEGSPFEQLDRGMLRLGDALGAADREAWDEVAEHTQTALRLFADEVAPPLIAIALRLATQAELARGSAGAGSAMAYCDWSARRRWDARLQLLAAARASLEAEQLRVERDEHEHQAHVDELTGLANRRGYTRHAERLRAGGCEALSVLVVDIDAFKAVNDRFGHAVGDAVLVQVAQVLAGGTRSADLVARLGGDEFLVLLDGLDAEAAQRRAADMVDRLAAVDWSVIAADLEVSISIGIATGRSDDPQPFLVRADEALYQAKRGGGAAIALSDGDTVRAS